MVPPLTVIYARHSRGGAASIERQLEDGRTLAAARGWPDPLELTDTVTASGAKTRAGFERLIELIRSDRPVRLIGWTWERLERNRADGLELIEAGKEHGTLVALVRGSDMDLSTPAGRMVADILGAMGRAELDALKDRQRRQLQQALDLGQRSGGRRPFGYTSTMEPIEVEAQAVRDGYAMLLAGASLPEIAREWNARGLVTPQAPKGADPGTPNPWSRGSIRKCLLKACYAGLRSHKGVVVGEAAWPAIVERSTWEAAQYVLLNRPRPSFAAQRLLTGIATCGICGATVHAGGRSRGMGAVYRCSKGRHLTRDLADVEAYVEAVILARLRHRSVARALAPQAPDLGPLRKEAEQLRGRRDALADDLALDEVTLARRVRAINARLDEIAAEEAAAMRGHRLAGFAAAVDVEALWVSADMATRRAIIETLVTVELLAVGRGTRTFRPESIVIAPRA